MSLASLRGPLTSVPFLALLLSCASHTASDEPAGSAAAPLTDVPTATWTSIETGIGAQVHPLMAFDADRNVVVAFTGGATSALNATWEWNGTTWTHRTPAHAPFSRDG